MAKKNTKESQNKETSSKENKPSRKLTRQQKFTFGVLLALLAIALLLSFVSYFLTGNNDQSQVLEVFDRKRETENWLGKIGAFLADFFIVKGFGVASFFFVRVLFLAGAYLVLDISLGKLKRTLFWDLYLIIIISVLFGFFWNLVPELAGTIGYEMNLFVQDYIGKVGTGLVLAFGVVLFLIFKIKISPDKIKDVFDRPHKELSEELNQNDLLQDLSFEDNSKPSPDIVASTDINTGDDDFIIREDDEAISKIELKPNMLVKTDLSTTQLDVNLTAEFNKSFWLGSSYRVQDAIVANFGFNYYMRNNGDKSPNPLKVGIAYDFTTHRLRDEGEFTFWKDGEVNNVKENNRSFGSVELYLGYCIMPRPIREFDTYVDPLFL